MRQALNENKTVQLIMIGVLLVAAAFLMMTRMKGSDSGDTAASASATGSTEVGVDVSVDGESVSSATAVVPDSLVAGAAATAPTVALPTSVSPEALIPGRGLPAEVVTAWKGGDAIVLLVVKPAAVDDKLVTLSVASLAGRPGISVFIAPADEVARYSRITQAVGVSQVPALVVVRPRRISGAVPQAQVSYGFRSSQSVVQAVDDALYSGKDNGPYHPG